MSAEPHRLVSAPVPVTKNIGREIIEETGMDDGLEVTDEVFQSPSSICSTRPKTASTRSKAVLVATMGSS